jgi:Ca-activated chloride channel homolog
MRAFAAKAGRRAAVALALLVPVAGTLAAEDPKAGPARPELIIEEPAPGQFMSGPSLLRGRVEPAGLPVRRVTFSVDGAVVCALDAPPWECGWDAGTDAAARNVRAVAVLADGARLVDTVRTQDATFAPSSDVAVVQVAATVSDGDGKLVKGLTRDAFRVYEDGQPQELTHFIGEDAERELVVAVDMSGSMAPAMAVCRDAVKRFLASLRPIDHVTLLAFNDGVFTVARREAAPEARVRAVDRLRSWGSTAFYDAVLKGLTLLERNRGRRALVVFTDGEDMVSHASAADVQARIEVSATPVYIVAQGRGMREPALKRVLDRVAGVSGGRAFYSDRIEQLEGLFAEIREDIASQYLLAYAPAETGQDGRWREIRVEVSGKSKYTVRARQGYRAVRQGR